MGIVIADSIALQILDCNSLVVGVGNELKLYNKRTVRKLVTKLRGKVHGIVKFGDKLLVHGESEFVILRFTREYQFELLHQGVLSDWISSAIFLKDEPSNFVLLTSHSVALRCDISTGNIHDKSSCIDKSTLYCSHLHGDSWNKLVIFSGNALGELLIWSPSSALIGNKHQLLHRIQAHNGVIFSIDYNEEIQLLSTTSDDRSIKFWKVFNEMPCSWIGVKIHHLTSGYGHEARVFQNKIICDGDQNYAITAGEDSYFCVWQCNGELLYKRREHFGATIWNLAYDELSKTLFTVGSTGMLRAFNLGPIMQGGIDRFQLLPTFAPESYIAKVKFLNKTTLIGATNHNRLLYTELSKPSWQEVFSNEICDLRQCTVLEVNHNVIAYCSYKHLTLIEYDTDKKNFNIVYDGSILNGVIRAFHYLKKDCFLISDETGACLLLTEYLRQKFPIKLPKCKEPWITAALLINNELLLASNRHGNFLLYKLDEGNYDLVMTLKRPHGSLGATAFALIELTQERALIQSAGHDGSLKMLGVECSTGKLEVRSRESIPIRWVEDINYEYSDVPLLFGFNENHFVAWSKIHDFICQIYCGGGHRCWHYNLWKDSLTNEQWLFVIFIKNKTVRLHRLKLFNKLTTSVEVEPPNMWHTKACNVASLIPSASDNGNAETLIVTGGDDNLIKVFSYLSNDNQFLERTEIHSHISNVRALKAIEMDKDHCLIFSGGGRAQLCISKLNLRKFDVHQLLTYTIRPTSESSSSKVNVYNINAETRIIAIDVVQIGCDNYNIYLGCSDGYVRKLLWNVNELPTPHRELFYGQCVLQVRLLCPDFVFIAGTDGYIQMYDVELANMKHSLQHHASGVNTLDIQTFKSSPKLCHILSGGDDQMVVYSIIDLKQLQTIHNTRLDWIHTAQVTAAQLRFENNHVIAYTSGVDQEICVFDMETGQLNSNFRSCIADIKGLCIDESNTCFIYGSGLQIYKFVKKKVNYT